MIIFDSMKNGLFIIMVSLIGIPSLAQNIYCKNFSLEILHSFSDSTNKIEVKPGGNVDDKNYVVLTSRFFPAMRLKKIIVAYKKQKELIKTKSPVLNLFKKPKNRIYKIYIGTDYKNTLDSVSFNYLSCNSKVGLIGREITRIEDYSTSGFFNLFGLGFKKFSKAKVHKYEYDIEMRMIEVGLGYQLKNLAFETEQKTTIDKWKDPDAYASYLKRTKGKYMSAEAISNFINDFPVYVSKGFK